MEDSFEKVVTEYKHLILSIMKSLHIYRDHESFYQVGLIALWEAHSRFDQSKAKFSTFAYVTIRGRLLEHLSRENRYYDNHQRLQPDDSLNLADPNVSLPFEKERLNLFCEGLTANQRLWVQKRIIEDKRVIDIAKEQKVSTDAVKSWGYAAVKKMKRNIVQFELM